MENNKSTLVALFLAAKKQLKKSKYPCVRVSVHVSVCYQVEICLSVLYIPLSK